MHRGEIPGCSLAAGDGAWCEARSGEIHSIKVV
jgi:hypothetical protein